MLMYLVLVLMIGVVFCDHSCYWNRKCSYDLFSSKTPYDSVRGDLRDTPNIDCRVVSIWSLHRHGNRNPGSSVTDDMKLLQEKILNELKKKEPSGGEQSTVCAQDLEDLRHWKWNTTLEESANFLTGIGYEEIYDIGKRISQKYLAGVGVPIDKVYFRATNEQRTMTSAIALVHGLTGGTTLGNFTSSIDVSNERDDVIRPYENCDKYQKEVKNGPVLAEELAAYDSGPELMAVRDRVQAKLNMAYELTSADVYTLYELCRFERSWTPKLQSPWCSFFTDQDLMVLEYRDDVRHYHRNGYGSLVNVNLGTLPLKDLYDNFENASRGYGKVLVSYFTHDTMMEMVFCALDLYRDAEPLRGAVINNSRQWRTSEIAAFATNFIAVLYRCEESGRQVHRVQILINEKPTDICPDEGCTWQQFQNKFQIFSTANLDFCKVNDVTYSSEVNLPGNSNAIFNYQLVLSLCTSMFTIAMIFR